TPPNSGTVLPSNTVRCAAMARTRAWAAVRRIVAVAAAITRLSHTMVLKSLPFVLPDRSLNPIMSPAWRGHRQHAWWNHQNQRYLNSPAPLSPFVRGICQSVLGILAPAHGYRVDHSALHIRIASSTAAWTFLLET